MLIRFLRNPAANPVLIKIINTLGGIFKSAARKGAGIEQSPGDIGAKNTDLVKRLFENHYDDLLDYARLCLNEREMAEDFIQSTFLEILMRGTNDINLAYLKIRLKSRCYADHRLRPGVKTIPYHDNSALFRESAYTWMRSDDRLDDLADHAVKVVVDRFGARHGRVMRRIIRGERPADIIGDEGVSPGHMYVIISQARKAIKTARGLNAII